MARTGKCWNCGAPSDPLGIGGRKERCLECKVSAGRARRARWLEKNKEADLAAKAAWRDLNPEANERAKKKWRRANLEAVNAKGKAWKKANPEAMFVYRLRKYGLTPDAFAVLLESQGNRCAVCEGHFTEKQGPCIDHCHRSTKVRGLLCVRCNAGLGAFLERPEVLEAGARYLRRHNGIWRR